MLIPQALLTKDTLSILLRVNHELGPYQPKAESYTTDREVWDLRANQTLRGWFQALTEIYFKRGVYFYLKILENYSNVGA
jgi:hypothetical protein